MSEQPPSRIPAPPMDQFNYALEGLGCMSMHLVIEFGGCLDTGRLGAAVDATLRMVPVLRSRFVEAPSPCWEVISSCGAKDIVSITVSTDRERDLQRVLALPVYPATRPPLRLDIIRSEGADTLCISVHHAAMDAFGLIVYAEILAALYRDPGLFAGDLPPPCLDRSIAGMLPRFNGTGSAVTMSPPEGQPHPGWAFPAPEGGVDEQAFAIRTLPVGLLPEIRDTAHRLGATVNDMLIAAFFSALCDYIRPEPGLRVPVLVSIDLRRYLGGGESGALPGAAPLDGAGIVARARQIANLSVAFDVMMPTGAFTFEERVRQAHAEMRERKAHDPGLSSAVAIEAFGDAGFGVFRERVQTMKNAARGSEAKTPFLGNIGVIPEPAVAFSPDLPVRNAYVVGIVIHPPGVAMGVTTFRNRLTLSIGYGSASIPPPVMEGFMDTIVLYLNGDHERKSGTD